MEATELAGELGQQGALELLQQGALVRLAYNGHDGLPRVIPVGFLWTRRTIVICTAVGSPKVGELQNRPDVALTIDTGASPSEARSLLIRGSATVHIVDGVPAEYIEAAAKTMDPAMMKEFEAAVSAMYEQMARITITPTWARFYDFGAGRLPTVLREMGAG